QIFYTVVATMALASLLTGLLFLLLGTFRLGNLIRYIPYPVIGGFLAGTGWLLFQGGMGVLVDVSLAEPLALFRPGVWLRWVPGLAVALLLLVVLRRYSHPLILPGILISAIGLFYVVLFLGGVPVAAA